MVMIQLHLYILSIVSPIYIHMYIYIYIDFEYVSNFKSVSQCIKSDFRTLEKMEKKVHAK